MRILIQNSLFFLFLFGFFISNASLSLDTVRIKYLPQFEAIKYRAMIDVLGKHLSGILIIKNIDNKTNRCVFLNEMGITFFDLSLEENQYHYENIMSSLNKKGVKISLAKNLGMILMNGIYKSIISEENTNTETTLKLKLKRKGYVEYKIEKQLNQIPTIINKNQKGKKFISIYQFYNSTYTMPDSIFVDHHQVNFKISLKQIYATE